MNAKLFDPSAPDSRVDPPVATALSSSAPNAALGLTVHGSPAPAEGIAAAQTPRGRGVLWIVLLICASPVVLSYLMYFGVRPQSRTNYGTLVEPQWPLPADTVVPAYDLAGRSVPLQTLKGQWLLVVVAPPECGQACEQKLFMQRQLREMTGAAKARIDKVWLVVGTEPLAPALLTAVQAAPPVTILRVGRDALAQWLQPAPGHALEEHLYVVDPLGHWMMRSPPQPDPLRIKKDLERLLRASSSWDRPGRSQ